MHGRKVHRIIVGALLIEKLLSAINLKAPIIGRKDQNSLQLFGFGFPRSQAQNNRAMTIIIHAVKKLIFIFLFSSGAGENWPSLSLCLHGKYKKSCSWQFSVQVLDNLLGAHAQG
jgi:hypothetical protein